MGNSKREPQPADRRITQWLFPCLIVLVGGVAYANSLEGPFIYDDEGAVVNNPYIRDLSRPWRIFLAGPDRPTEGRPVISFSLALNYAVGRLEDVRGYHAVNVAVHILCALLLYGVVRRTLCSEKLEPRFGPVAAGLALASALIWMVHPLASECVSYITQRTESIMALFFLLTLYCAIRAGDSPRRLWWIAAAVISCALGMASKEVMVTAPLVVLLYDLVFRMGSMRERLRGRWPLYAGLAATWGVLAALMLAFPHRDTVGFSHGITAWQYAKSQCPVIVDYLRRAFWPHPLVLDYGFVEPVSFREVLPYALLVVALLAASIVVFLYEPMIGFLAAWFFIILGPTSSFVPLPTEVGAERRMYLPLAGLVVLVVVAGHLLLERWTGRRSGGAKRKASRHQREGPSWLEVALLVPVVGALAWATVRRNEDYRSREAIWKSAVEAAPHNARAHLNFGTLALNRSKRVGDATEKQRYRDQALEHVQLALRLKDDYDIAHYNLGLIFYEQKEFARAVEQYQLALDIDEDNPRAYFALGNAQLKLKRFADAASSYQRAIDLDPDFADPLASLGILDMLDGRFEQAADHLQRAIAIDPRSAMAHYYLGDVMLSQENWTEAEACFQRALRLSPNYRPAQDKLKQLRDRLEQNRRAAGSHPK